MICLRIRSLTTNQWALKYVPCHSFLMFWWEIYDVCFQCVLWVRPILSRKSKQNSTMSLWPQDWSTFGTFSTVINPSLFIHTHTVQVDGSLFASLSYPGGNARIVWCPSPAFGWFFKFFLMIPSCPEVKMDCSHCLIVPCLNALFAFTQKANEAAGTSL